jgi:aryl-alcohol dehydrogenase-like predicted oxidoreductase
MSDDSPIRMKPFGRHDVSISALGFGGHHLGDAPDVATAIRIVQEAVDSGITFFDNCWEYHRGKTEDWMGQGLKGRRDKVFLMTKVCTHLDLWQVHGVGWDNDPELFMRPNGAAEALLKAKQEGKVRYLGFTGHKDPAVHLKMINTGFPFDAVQMPLNPFDAHFLSFAEMILPECARRGIAALGMKPLSGHGEPITNGELTVEEALRYAMSLPVATTITGIDKLEVLRQNVKIAQNYKPMTPQEMQAIRDRVKQVAGDGRYEIYKVSLRFDNPEARMAHGFPLDEQSVEVKEMLKATENTGFPFPDVKQQQQ